ncbi:MAG: ABC transporter ATP-binding protein [Pseudobdellovibrionaceae bacterium]
MIEIRNVFKKYPPREVLKGINITCPGQKVTGVIGPNSCGKTTLMKCILGLVPPDKGEIRIAGKLVGEEASYRADLGYMSQTTSFPENLKIHEIFCLLEELRNKSSSRKEELIHELALDPFLDKTFGVLSGGAKQRVGAVAALMFDPSTLVLDEPTASLDPLAAVLMRKIIRRESEKGKTIILISHILGEVEELASELALMIEGRIMYFGGLQAFKESEKAATLEQAVVNHLQSTTSVQS